MDMSELFWGSSVEEIKKGYIFEEASQKYKCLICGAEFEKGIIYQNNSVFYDAEKHMKNHIVNEHGSIFNYLINMNKRYTGLTESQKEVLKHFKAGHKDKEITEIMGVESTSTIRSYRFKLKEREKEAKIFLSIMELLNEKEQSDLISIHKGATMVDERYAITEREREDTIKNYFKGEEGRLTTFPSKEKKKIIVLQKILSYFEINREYSEKEVNLILEKIYEDFATIRRYLVEYGFMERSKDCSWYKVKV